MHRCFGRVVLLVISAPPFSLLFSLLLLCPTFPRLCHFTLFHLSYFASFVPSVPHIPLFHCLIHQGFSVPLMLVFHLLQLVLQLPVCSTKATLFHILCKSDLPNVLCSNHTHSNATLCSTYGSLFHPYQSVLLNATLFHSYSSVPLVLFYFYYAFFSVCPTHLRFLFLCFIWTGPSQGSKLYQVFHLWCFFPLYQWSSEWLCSTFARLVPRRGSAPVVSGRSASTACAL